MSSAAQSEASLHSADGPSSKELFTDRKTKDSDREMQHVEALDENTRYDEVRALTDQLCRSKRRCAKLGRQLQEKELQIQSMQEQQQLHFPLLMHETIRNLQSMDGTLSEERQTASDGPISHSVMSFMDRNREDVDVCMHEYEQQIAKLYEENRNERLKNEMLRECLRDQKHAKAKWMKACKQARQKHQTIEDSGIRQMLMDIEARCDALDKKNAQTVDELLVERSLRENGEAQTIALTNQLEELRYQSAKWEGIVASKNETLQQARDQICEHQLTIENLTADLKLADRCTAHSPDHYLDDDAAEVKRLKHIISTERAALNETKQQLSRIAAENETLRGRRATVDEIGCREEHVAPCAAKDVFDRVLIQTYDLKCQLRSLKNMLKRYDETSLIDVNALDEDNWCQRDYTQDSIRSCVDYATQLSEYVVELAHYLLEMREIVEDVAARLIGESCALQ